VLPPLTEVRRSATIRLRSTEATPPQSPSHPIEPSTSAYPSTVATTMLETPSFVWLDVNVNAEIADVVAALSTRRVKMTQAMVEDLLEADAQGKITVHADPRDAPLGLSFHGVKASEGGGRLDSSKTGSLQFQLVEAVVTPTWLVTCFHSGTTNNGVDIHQLDEPPLGAVRDLVARECTRRTVVTGPTVLLALIEHMAVSHLDAQSQLEAWLESWELEFFRDLEQTERATISHLLVLLNETRRRLGEFELVLRTGERRLAEQDAGDPAVVNVQSTLEDCRDRVQAMLGRLRADIDLLTMNGISRQTADAEASRRAEDELRKQLEKVTALLLVPSLVIGFFGANTAIPGAGTWWGLILMLGLACMSSAAVYTFLYRRRNQRGKSA
jgi:Mg2+ and Co2+ transporter CorA